MTSPHLRSYVQDGIDNHLRETAYRRQREAFAKRDAREAEKNDRKYYDEQNLKIEQTARERALRASAQTILDVDKNARLSAEAKAATERYNEQGGYEF